MWSFCFSNSLLISWRRFSSQFTSSSSSASSMYWATFFFSNASLPMFKDSIVRCIGIDVIGVSRLWTKPAEPAGSSVDAAPSFSSSFSSIALSTCSFSSDKSFLILSTNGLFRNVSKSSPSSRVSTSSLNSSYCPSLIFKPLNFFVKARFSLPLCSHLRRSLPPAFLSKGFPRSHNPSMSSSSASAPSSESSWSSVS